MYWILHYFPFVAIPLAIIAMDLAVHFKKREQRSWILLGSLAVFLMATSATWLVFRGDREAIHWARKIASETR
jgi:hypothetical protein